MNTSNIEKVKEFIFECAVNQDDIGNCAIDASMKFDISINDFLKILKETLTSSNIVLYEDINDGYIDLSEKNLYDLFKYNRYNINLSIKDK